MKKRYEELELEVVYFDAEDVITTSGDGDCPLDGQASGCSGVEGPIDCPAYGYEK